jgi:glycerol-3-phosphate acyltransferase PlsY
VAAIGLPIATYFFYPGKNWFFLLALMLGVMAVWRHRGNIQRLRNGSELRFGDKKS